MYIYIYISVSRALLSSLGTTLVVEAVDVAKLGIGVVLAIFRPVGQVKVETCRVGGMVVGH
jgi:hypothetical protein